MTANDYNFYDFFNRDSRRFRILFYYENAFESETFAIDMIALQFVPQ